MDPNRPPDIGWRQFAIRVIEALRWPAAFVAAAIILREPIGRIALAVQEALQ